MMKVPAGTPGDDLFVEKHHDRLPTALLTIAAVARLLAISPSGVRRLQRQRCIPFLKIGGSVRFSPADVLAYIERKRVETI